MYYLSVKNGYTFFFFLSMTYKPHCLLQCWISYLKFLLDYCLVNSLFSVPFVCVCLSCIVNLFEWVYFLLDMIVIS